MRDIWPFCDLSLRFLETKYHEKSKWPKTHPFALQSFKLWVVLLFRSWIIHLIQEQYPES